MILVDDRAGSRDLCPHLPQRHHTLTRLEFGDACFTGNGPDGQLNIGYELKSIPDLLACMQNGRYAGYQLPGMQRTYDINYLIVHDRVKSDHADDLLYHRGLGKWARPFGGRRNGQTLTTLRKWLLTIEMQAGIRVTFADRIPDAAHYILAHYHWWQSEWTAHKSLNQFNDSIEVSAFQEPLTLRKVAAQFKMIRWVRSRAVAKHFGSIINMVLADVDEWLEIDGIGPKIARGVHEEIRRSTKAPELSTSTKTPRRKIRRK